MTLVFELTLANIKVNQIHCKPLHLVIPFYVKFSFTLLAKGLLLYILERFYGLSSSLATEKAIPKEFSIYIWTLFYGQSSVTAICSCSNRWLLMRKYIVPEISFLHQGIQELSCQHRRTDVTKDIIFPAKGR